MPPASRLMSPRVLAALVSGLVLGVTSDCTCGGIGADKLKYACTSDADCATGYSCVEAVCQTSGGTGGGSAGGSAGGGVGGGTGGGGSDVLDAGCENTACGCFDAGPCYRFGLTSPQLRAPWDGGAGCSQGAWACGPAGLVCAGQNVPQTEFCDGIDSDCDGIPDPLACGCVAGKACYLGPPGSINANPEGKSTCRPGVWSCSPLPGACNGQVTPVALEQCDGLDDDCDGVVDNNVDLPSCGVGVCASMKKRCTAGALGECVYGANNPPGYSTFEVCGDGLDNDCNGLVEEGCTCVLDAGVSCWTGAPSACPADAGCVGICARGVQQCNALADGGTSVGACSGQTSAVSENAGALCSDSLDNDCDGLIDCQDPDCAGQRCGGGSLLTCAAGACACVVSGGSVETSEASCGDGRDNDCDGLTDCQDPTCANQACGASGQTCSGTNCGCVGNGGAPEPSGEVTCSDASDNDCDGLLDCADSQCNAKVCGANGKTCVSGSCACSGNGGTAQPNESLCTDAKDNDCDGLVDCADPECAGKSGCGGTSCLPDGGAPATTETSCGNGLDDDCDGTIDCVDTDCLRKRCDTTKPAAVCCGSAANATACKDLGNDPSNCGWCGVTCSSGSCNPIGNGTPMSPRSGVCACGPAPVCPTVGATPNGPNTCSTAHLNDGGTFCTCNGNDDRCGTSTAVGRCYGGGANSFCAYRP